MFTLDWKITIGDYRLGVLDGVEIKRSVEQLSATAKIKLPASAYNKPMRIEEKIKRGDRVVIELGYNGNLLREFEGYIESIGTDNDGMTLDCEDGIFQFRVPVPDKEFITPSVKTILDYLIAHVNSEKEANYTISCSYDFSYDKFVVHNATAFDLLKKLQGEAKPNIYLRGEVLNIHPQYSEIFGHTSYNFGVNIESEDLKFRDADQRRYLVEVEGTGPDGKVIKVEEGTTDGDKLTLKISGVSDEQSLRKLAKEALLQRSYTGYEGSFDGWLVPYCDAGYKATIRDDDFQHNGGTYYVTGVEVSFSSSGGKRKITIGKRINEQ